MSMYADICDLIRKLPNQYGLTEMEAIEVHDELMGALEWDDTPDGVDAWSEIFPAQTRRETCEGTYPHPPTEAEISRSRNAPADSIQSKALPEFEKLGRVMGIPKGPVRRLEPIDDSDGEVHADKRICHAEGDTCLACPHYYGKADVCSYAPAEQGHADE